MAEPFPIGASLAKRLIRRRPMKKLIVSGSALKGQILKKIKDILKKNNLRLNNKPTIEVRGRIYKFKAIQKRTRKTCFVRIDLDRPNTPLIECGSF